MFELIAVLAMLGQIPLSSDCGMAAYAQEVQVAKSMAIKLQGPNIRIGPIVGDYKKACVRLLFSIDANGKARHIEIVETSGERRLDSAAKRALENSCFKVPSDIDRKFTLIFSESLR